MIEIERVENGFIVTEKRSFGRRVKVFKTWKELKDYLGMDLGWGDL